MSKSSSYKAIALLALIQGIFGLLRAYNWVQIGANLLGQGLLLLPFVGAVAVMRGMFIAIVALLYILFFVGALLEKNWAWLGVTAAIINLLLALSARVQGASVMEAVVLLNCRANERQSASVKTIIGLGRFE
jgi:hypothetical protein